MSFYQRFKGRSTYWPWWDFSFLAEIQREGSDYSGFWGIVAVPFPHPTTGSASQLASSELALLCECLVGLVEEDPAEGWGLPNFSDLPSGFTVPSAKPCWVFINLPVIVAALFFSVSSCSLPQVSARLSPVSLQASSPKILSQLVVLWWV